MCIFLAEKETFIFSMKQKNLQIFLPEVHIVIPDNLINFKLESGDIQFNNLNKIYCFVTNKIS